MARCRGRFVAQPQTVRGCLIIWRVDSKRGFSPECMEWSPIFLRVEGEKGPCHLSYHFPLCRCPVFTLWMAQTCTSHSSAMVEQHPLSSRSRDSRCSCRQWGFLKLNQTIYLNMCGCGQHVLLEVSRIQAYLELCHRCTHLVGDGRSSKPCQVITKLNDASWCFIWQWPAHTKHPQFGFLQSSTTSMPQQACYLYRKHTHDHTHT